jgi:hypothetical protein
MATEQVLNEGLARIRGLSETQNEYYQSARELLHQTLVETYLWWREASQKPGYLEKRFTEENIKYSNKLNRPNFAPVVRLAMRVQPTKRVQISNFATAMNAIDDEYIRNSHRYINRDVVAELVDWIHETGGLRGITGTKKEEVEYNAVYRWRLPEQMHPFTFVQIFVVQYASQPLHTGKHTTNFTA